MFSPNFPILRWSHSSSQFEETDEMLWIVKAETLGNLVYRQALVVQLLLGG